MLTQRLIRRKVRRAIFSRHGSYSYSRTSLSRTRLFRITAYLEVKIWSLFLNETMPTGNKIMWKTGEIAPKEQFLLFSTLLYINIFLTSGVKLHIHLFNVIVQVIVFLTLLTLICRGTDISKYFSESLGIRDNESRQYLYSTCIVNCRQLWLCIQRNSDSKWREYSSCCQDFA